MYTYPVYEKDSGRFVGNFTSDEIKRIGFKSDHYVIYFN
jgi:hypothetical protein